MTELSRIRRRQLYAGWIKWTLVPVIFFSALYIDGWVNVKKQIRDYKIENLYDESCALKSQLSVLTSRLAQLRNIDRLTAEAEKMGLLDPTAHQFHTIAYREIRKRIPVMPMNRFQTAQSAPAITSVELERPGLSEPMAPVPAEIMAPPVPSETPILEAQYSPVFEHYEVPVRLIEAGPAAEPLESLPPPLPEDPELSKLGLEGMLAAL